jgi:hypothetical protein
MATLEISTMVNRLLEEVLAFVSNPENKPKWGSRSNEVRRSRVALAPEVARIGVVGRTTVCPG